MKTTNISIGEKSSKKSTKKVKDTLLNHLTKTTSGVSMEKIMKVLNRVPPLWDLESYIAVNPFMGYTDDSFLNSLKHLESVLDEALVPDQKLLDGVPHIPKLGKKKNQSQKIESLLGGFLASYTDKGISFWPNPWKQMDLWNAFLAWSSKDPLMNSLLDENSQSSTQEIPKDSFSAIQYLTKINRSLDESRMEKLFFLLPGWASYFRKSTWLAEFQEKSDLPCFLAILCYLDTFIPDVTQSFEKTNQNSDIEKRYQYMEKAEMTYRSELLKQLQENTEFSKESKNKKVRFLFCIDVRSEPMRRHLESESVDIETEGFAGFFGMPIAWKYWTKENLSHSPAIIKPPFTLHGSGKLTNPKRIMKIKSWIQKIKRTFPIGFHYVESAGFLSSLGLAAKTMGFAQNNQFRRKITDEDISMSIESLGLDSLVGIAEGILNHLSWKENFPEYILITGHGSHTYNNPHEAGLSCGACSGQTGELSSRFATELLNREDLRQALVSKGIKIPSHVKFIPALHETVTDSIQILREDLVDEDFLKDLKLWISNAQKKYQLEKFANLGLDGGNAINRSKNWAEVFPEAGLAGCGSMIVAKNFRTRNCNLEGRSFLNSYNWEEDRNGSTLELILTAPVVVASWINLQYFASTVSPETFGAGNKLIHSIVGNLGVVEGNSWNLRSGLPLQSVHDGERFIHQPIRLQVVIEAPIESIEKVLFNNEGIANLVDGEWIHLIAWNPEAGFMIRAKQKWINIKLGSIDEKVNRD